MIRSSLYFTYDNQKSSDFGIWNVNMSTGLQSEPFAADSSIREVVIRGNDRPYFQGIQLSPLKFTLSFAFENSFSSDELRDVARWLKTPNYFSPLQFFDGTNEDLNQIYYALFVDSSELITNCLNQGYVNLNVRCSDAYAYSPVLESFVYDYSSNTVGGTNYTFENYGDVDTKPIITIEMTNDTTFTITNNSNGGQLLSFTGLTVGETITVDCENEIVTSDTGNYRYDNMTSSSVFLPMVRGFNYLNIKGNVKVKWKHQDKFIVG